MAISGETKDPVARLAEQQTWITDTAQERVQASVRNAVQSLGGDPLRSALHGDWLHEPLHAVLTDIPVGAWTAAVAFDAIGALGGGSKLDTAADASVVVGLIGATGAAVTGLHDWSEVRSPAARRIGAVHALLNIAGTALFTASCVQRGRGQRSSGRALAALGYLVVSASAHLGGSLVYEHGIGVAPSPSTGVVTRDVQG